MMLTFTPERRRLLPAAGIAGLVMALFAGALYLSGPAGAQTSQAQGNTAGKPKGAAANAKEGSAWVKLCEEQTLKNDQGEKKINVCLTHHERFHPTTGQPLISAAVREIDDPQTETVMIMVPLGRLLKAGLAMKVDENKPTQMPYAYCTALGCVAETKATPEVVESFKKGSELVIGTVDVTGKRIAFKVPLNGFTRALEGPPIDRKVYAKARKEMFEKIRERQKQVLKRAKEAADKKKAGGAAAPQNKAQ